MEHTTSEITALEAFFLEAGLPVTEVEMCPVADCAVCTATLSQAA